ncbi:MAG TPA: FAD-dependent monooxygenase, partial [Bryobacteraceae bacterium]|nr:FAD-dependent monooxygenase [Bryobacteraceae bacterium]
REQMESDESIRALLSPWGDLSEMDIERRAVYRFHARVADTFRRGRTFLVGDAAHITPPFVGQGLVAGLRDAANLSWKLAWVIKGRASEKILNSYDAERRPHAAAMINLARLMGRLVMPGSPVAAWLIHGLLRQLRRIPLVRRYFDELGIKPKNRFACGLFVKGRSGSNLVRGGLLPQGWLRDAAGNMTLSDEVLGPSLTLVGFGANPAPALHLGALAAFSAAGGRIVEIGSRGQRGGQHADGSFFEDLDNTFIPTMVPHGWAAIVRPDRTVLHDGPSNDVVRLVRESLQLLGTETTPPNAARTAMAPAAP